MVNAFKSMFKVIANLVTIEDPEGTSNCGVMSQGSGGVSYICNRKAGHTGMHIAIAGTNDLLEIWGSYLDEDDNETLVKALDILTALCHVHDDRNCGEADKRGLMCSRKTGHKGLHVAVGSVWFGAAWEQ